MSTLKVDALSSKSTDTDLAITADGSGLVDIETGFKVSGTAGVPTADIRDDAVTLAKMAAGTDGNLISYDASGNPVAVATGTDGQVLTSSGPGAVCAFEDAAGGAWAVASTSAHSGTTLNVTGLTKGTMIIIENIVMATFGQFKCRTSTNAGVSYDSSASDYRWGLTVSYTTTVEANTNVADTEIRLQGGASIICNSGVMRLFVMDPSHTGESSVMYDVALTGPGTSSSVEHIRSDGIGTRDSAADIDAVSIYSAVTWSGDVTVLELNQEKSHVRYANNY